MRVVDTEGNLQRLKDVEKVAKITYTHTHTYVARLSYVRPSNLSFSTLKRTNHLYSPALTQT